MADSSLKSSIRARRNQTADMMWGGTLAIGLPILVALVVSALDPMGKGKRALEYVWDTRTKVERPPPPLSRELAQDMLKEVRRLYEQNYRSLFIPRVDRDELEFRERIREFDCAEKVLSFCGSVHLVRLKQALTESGSEIQDLAPAIEQWDRTIAQAVSELDRKNPIPKSMRTPVGTGASD